MSARAAGARVARVEDPRLLTGQGTYVDDVFLPAVLHTVFVRSPHARARIRAVDTSEASALPGVHHVFTATDLNPRMHEQWHTAQGPAAIDNRRPPLAEDEVRFAGDPVVMILAESRYVAEDAAELVDIDYEPLPAVVDYASAQEAATLVHPDRPANVMGSMSGPPPEPVHEVFDTAPHVVRRTLHQSAAVALPMEGRAIAAHWQSGAGELTIWASSQVPHEVRLFCSRLLDLPEHAIRVICKDTGGGFGQKAFIQREEMCVMLAAPLVSSPIKWIEDRQENLVAAGKSRLEHGTATMAFDEVGTMLAVELTHVQDAGSYPTPSPVGSVAVVGGLFPGPYRVPLASWSSTVVHTNTVGRSPYRGPWQFETLAREVMLDVAARELGMDPAELRRRNLLRPEDLPYQSPNGYPFDHVNPSGAFEEALRVVGYDEFRAEQARARAAGRYLGIGLSTFIEPTTAGFGVYGTEGATIRIEASGKILAYLPGGSAGNSIETTVVQLVADALGADLADVRTIQGDTAVTPSGGGTCGSRSGSMTAGAVEEAAVDLRERLVRIAAHKLEANPDDLELHDSRVTVRGAPTVGVSFAEVAAMAYLGHDDLPVGVPAGLEASARYKVPHRFTWVNAVHACTCAVDVDTGQVELLRYIVAEDCGPMINPNVVEGQVAGGTVQGIGHVLFEELAYDDAGNPRTTTFLDYLAPTAAEVPELEFGHIETPGPGVGGYKGVGEGGAIASPAAVVNAVADALAPFGVTITDLPLGPSQVLDLLDEARA